MQTSNSTPYGYIYKITNPINGKCYIGQTINNPKNRWHDYKKLKCKTQYKLYNALKKYGPENFLYEIFDDSSTNQEELDFLEDIYILCLDSIENGYNCKPGGRGRGQQTEEIKQKISQKLKGHKQSIETIQKRHESNKGQKHSEETKQKLSSRFKGVKRDIGIIRRIIETKKHNNYIISNNTKQKISEALKGNKNCMFGKHHTAETKQKMSQSHKCRVISEETRKKISKKKRERDRLRKNLIII